MAVFLDFVPILIMAVVFYLLLLRPQARKKRLLQKEAQEKRLPFSASDLQDVVVGGLNITRVLWILIAFGVTGAFCVYSIFVFARHYFLAAGVSDTYVSEIARTCIWSTQVGSGLSAVPCPAGLLGPIALVVTVVFFIIAIVINAAITNTKR